MIDASRYLSLAALQGALLAEPPALSLSPTRSDYDLNPAARPAGLRRLLPAAVLVPVVARVQPTVLFTLRSADLSRHAGQVSFPGGRSDDEDPSLVHTALRELEEETGITDDFVTVAGFLGVYETVTGFAVLPVVGLVREGFTVVPDAHEVDGVFEVPLAFLLDPANCQQDRREFNGTTRRFYAFRYQDHYIWGATAAILVELSERLR